MVTAHNYRRNLVAFNRPCSWRLGNTIGTGDRQRPIFGKFGNVRLGLSFSALGPAEATAPTATAAGKIAWKGLMALIRSAGDQYLRSQSVD